VSILAQELLLVSLSDVISVAGLAGVQDASCGISLVVASSVWGLLLSQE